MLTKIDVINATGAFFVLFISITDKFMQEVIRRRLLWINSIRSLERKGEMGPVLQADSCNLFSNPSHFDNRSRLHIRSTPSQHWHSESRRGRELHQCAGLNWFICSSWSWESTWSTWGDHLARTPSVQPVAQGGWVSSGCLAGYLSSSFNSSASFQWRQKGPSFNAHFVPSALCSPSIRSHFHLKVVMKRRSINFLLNERHTVDNDSNCSNNIHILAVNVQWMTGCQLTLL